VLWWKALFSFCEALSLRGYCSKIERNNELGFDVVVFMSYFWLAPVPLAWGNCVAHVVLSSRPSSRHWTSNVAITAHEIQNVDDEQT
jgi:hypothetical protein